MEEKPMEETEQQETQSTASEQSVAEERAAPVETPKTSSASDNKVYYLLSYLSWGFVGIILLFLKGKEDPDARYHAFNSIGFGLGVVVLNIVMGILGFTIGRLPGMGCILGIAGMLVFFAAGIYSIILAIKAFKGEKPEIPMLTSLVMEQAKNINL
jgi:uncharacterized membrane protein